MQTSLYYEDLRLWKKKDEILKSLQKFKIKIFNSGNGTKINTKCVLASPRSLC
jgi:hypothetical protein